MEKSIAIAGNMIVDYIKYIDSYPAPQTLAVISDMSRSVGGLACNCILALAKLDPALAIKAIGIVGEDEAGDYILSKFAAHPNVDTSGISRHGNTAKKPRGSSRKVLSTLPSGRATASLPAFCTALATAGDWKKPYTLRGLLPPTVCPAPARQTPSSP